MIVVCLLCLLLPVNPAVYASGDDSAPAEQLTRAVDLSVHCEDGDECGTHDCGNTISPVDKVVINHEVKTISVIITPYGKACGMCEGGSMVNVSSCGPYNYTGVQRYCTHYPYGVDLEMKSVVTNFKKCNKCGYTYDMPNTYNYQWDCRGFARP